ncbi:hypothetical protein DBL01_12355 [Acinetobacter pittii]|nr:hypothetical protein DBL01_12355 [Acinetobacter pittii]
MVAERKWVRRLVKTSSTPEGVPLPSYRNGRERDVHTKLFLRRNNPDVVLKRSATTDWQCRPARKW